MFLGPFVRLGIFLIPGVGPSLFAGPVVGYNVGALEGAVVVGRLSTNPEALKSHQPADMEAHAVVA